MSEKIQKVLANFGLGSRREIEQWISDGRIQVNGLVATLGDRIEEEDTIKLDGRVIKRREMSEQKPRVLIYNKLEGEVCTRSDPEGRPTVFDKLPRLRAGRWVVVGRLDINTTGLLLFTTDGALANKLMHPSTEVEREYVVRIHGEVTEEMVKNLRRGVELEDGAAQFKRIVRGREQKTNNWFAVTLLEGRNREVRRLWESQGVTVSRLKRTRYGCVSLPAAVSRGRWHELSENEVKQLYRSINMPVDAAFSDSSYLSAKAAREKTQRQETKRGRGREAAPDRESSQERPRRGAGRTQNKFDKSSAKPARSHTGARSFQKRERDFDDDFSARPPRTSAKPARARDDQRAPRSDFDAKPKRSFKDGEQRRDFSDRKPSREGSRDRFDKPRSDRPRSDKPRSGARSDFDAKPKRSFKDGEQRRDFSDRKSSREGSRDRFDKPRSDRPRSDKPRSGARSDFDAKPKRSFKDGEQRRDFSDRKPSREGSRDRFDKPRSDRPRSDKPRSTGARTDKPRQNASRNTGGFGKSGGSARKPSTRKPR